MTSTNEFSFVFDENSLVVNRLIITSMTIGGPNERKLPPLEVADALDGSVGEFIYDGAIPSSVFTKVIVNNIELEKCDTLLQLRKSYREKLDSSVRFGVGTLEQSVRLAFEHQPHTKLVTGKAKNSSLAFRKRGIEILCGYELVLFGSSSLDFVTNLTILIKSYQSDQDGFDWFISIIFLMARCDVKVAAAVLANLSVHKSSKLIWPLIGSNSYMQFICCTVEGLLEKELGTIYAAFILSEYCPSQVCKIIFK